MTPATAAAKRAIDMVGSAVLLVASIPLMVLLALAVRLDSPGAVLYRAIRTGRNGATFQMLKLRTMAAGAAGGPVTAPDDSRITRLGAWLRLFKLDELPQLWNVLRGDMSLVGPRPEDPAIVHECYTEAQRRVLEVRPGLTGPGQVRFFPDMSTRVPAGVDSQAYYRDVQLAEKLSVDLAYLDRATVAYDLWLIGRTAWCVLVKSWWIVVTRRPTEMDRR